MGPGAEDSLDSTDQLFLRIGREFCTDLGLILFLELISQRLQVISSRMTVTDVIEYLQKTFILLAVDMVEFYRNIVDALKCFGTEEICCAIVFA